MDEALIRQVRRRAHDTCEYCLVPQTYYPAPFQIDHIIAISHGGPTALRNLALSCLHCALCGELPPTGPFAHELAKRDSPGVRTPAPALPDAGKACGSPVGGAGFLRTM